MVYPHTPAFHALDSAFDYSALIRLPLLLLISALCSLPAVHVSVLACVSGSFRTGPRTMRRGVYGSSHEATVLPSIGDSLQGLSAYADLRNTFSH